MENNIVLPRYTQLYSWNVILLSICYLIIGLTFTQIRYVFYGVASFTLISYGGIFLAIFLTIKTLIASAILYKKRWGILLGYYETIVVIMIGIFNIIFSNFDNQFLHFARIETKFVIFEVIFTIPYFLELKQIRKLIV